MSDKVQKAFERGVNALFADAQPAKPSEPSNVFKMWNTLAVKFPKLYGFAEFSKRARMMEEKIILFHKLDPRSEVDRGAIAYKFMQHLEHDTSNTLEDALDNWWKELSHD